MADVIGRIAGVDYGSRRIGLAISDSDGKLASPAGTLESTASPARDAEQLARWAEKNGVRTIVVGLPLNMDGSIGPQAKISEKFVEQLRQHTTLPVETWDERLTSFQADEWLRESGLSAKAKARRRDALAAQAILQAYLDGRSREGGKRDSPVIN